MKNEITSVFENINKQRAAFIPYFVLGLPDLKKSIELVVSCKDYFDIVELGIPFTDPVADGPTIQQGSLIALENGYTMKDYFRAAKEIADRTQKPVVFMLYYNQVYAYGIKKFMKKAASSGVRGLIIPDILPESDKELTTYADKSNISTVFLVTQNTEEDRMRNIIQKSGGFIYLTALTGITGERSDVAKGLEKYLKMIKQYTDKPVCVGFGISKPEHVENISGFADGVIVGSAIVRRVIEGQEVVPFVKELFSSVKER